jgi:hypothetical protein
MKNGKPDPETNLEGLFPSMPGSFANRVDDALNEVRGGRVRRRRIRPSVAAAYVCAASFAALFVAALIVPTLRDRARRDDHRVICAVQPSPAAAMDTFAAIRAAIEAQVRCDGMAVSVVDLSVSCRERTYLVYASVSLLGEDGAPCETRTLQIEMVGEDGAFRILELEPVETEPTLSPTPEPPPVTATPVPTLGEPAVSDDAPPTQQAQTTARKRYDTAAEQALRAYYDIRMGVRSGGAASEFVVPALTTEQTMLWFHEMELWQTLYDGGALAQNAYVLTDCTGGEPVSVDYGYLRIDYTCRVEAACGCTMEETYALTFNPQSGQIVGVEPLQDNPCYALLRTYADAALADGMTREEAARHAYSTVTTRLLRDNGLTLLYADADGGASPMLLAAGEAVSLLPVDRLDGDGRIADELRAAIDASRMGWIAPDQLSNLNPFALGGTIVEDGFAVYRLDDGASEPACIGDLETVCAWLNNDRGSGNRYAVAIRLLPMDVCAMRPYGSDAPHPTPEPTVTPEAIPVTEATERAPGAQDGTILLAIGVTA